MKLYAKQIAPEYQESPLFIDECFPDNIILCGNRDYEAHTTEEYDRIEQCFDELCEEYENIKEGSSSYYKNITELLKDYFPGVYSTKKVHFFKTILEKYGTRYYYEGDYIIDMLELITGKEWRKRTIRGCCQSDWQEIIYPWKEWTNEAISEFETMYFNMGSEWIIHDSEEEPKSPEDISGYSIYCTSWDDEGIKRELVEAAGYEPEEIVLYEFSGYTKSPVYAKKGA
jgi:hypothetical protein